MLLLGRPLEPREQILVGPPGGLGAALELVELDLRRGVAAERRLEPIELAAQIVDPGLGHLPLRVDLLDQTLPLAAQATLDVTQLGPGIDHRRMTIAEQRRELGHPPIELGLLTAQIGDHRRGAGLGERVDAALQLAGAGRGSRQIRLGERQLAGQLDVAKLGAGAALHLEQRLLGLILVGGALDLGELGAHGLDALAQIVRRLVEHGPLRADQLLEEHGRDLVGHGRRQHR